MKRCGIYGIFNTANGKVLVGSSSNIISRWSVHRAEANHGKHYNSHFQSAWDKYGEKAFEFRVIEECCESSLIPREDYWMDFHNSMNGSFGYNLQKANRTVISEETRQKLREANRGSKHWNYGKHPSKETLQRLREMNKGRKHTEEWKRQQSERMKGKRYGKGWKMPEARKEQLRIAMKGNKFRKGLSPGMAGKHHTEESIRKISASKAGKPPWNKGIPCREETKKKIAIAKTNILQLRGAA